MLPVLGTISTSCEGGGACTASTAAPKFAAQLAACWQKRTSAMLFPAETNTINNWETRSKHKIVALIACVAKNTKLIQWQVTRYQLLCCSTQCESVILKRTHVNQKMRKWLAWPCCANSGQANDFFEVQIVDHSNTWDFLFLLFQILCGWWNLIHLSNQILASLLYQYFFLLPIFFPNFHNYYPGIRNVACCTLWGTRDDWIEDFPSWISNLYKLNNSNTKVLFAKLAAHDANFFICLPLKNVAQRQCCPFWCTTNWQELSLR